MKIFYLGLSLIISCFHLHAQQVPHKIDFADMELKLTKEAIADIQTSVDALTRSETYFQKKLEHVEMYMPIIERIFREEGLPEDFKYLVIQESALISDAVSSSNAVGFWQFKEISGLENDLRIDRIVDERKNIVSSTRAAANYLKNHNKVFNNWAYSLIAYQTGVGGAKSVINERYKGEKKMPISKNTYWYLKKYLAHKIAFEGVLGTARPNYYLKEVNDVQGLSLQEIASKYQVDVELVKEYNKWLSRGRVPEDKNYTVIIPLLENSEVLAVSISNKKFNNNTPAYDLSSDSNQPIVIEGNKPSKNATIAHEIKVNGLKAIVAASGYNVKSLAEKGGLSEHKFRRFNDMSVSQKLTIGEIYYLERKLNRAKYYYHTVYPGETMWDISQKYGLKLHKLYRKNRMKDPMKPEAGRVLWMRLNRPYSVDIEYKEIETPKEKQQLPAVEKDKQIQITTTEKSQEKENEPYILDKKFIEKDSSLNLKISDTLEVDPSIKQVKTFTTSMKTDSAIIESTVNETSEIVEEEDLNNESKEESLENEQLTAYSIKKGDTFFSIANRFNMRISELLEINNLSIKEPLAIDQIIQVKDQQTENLVDNNIAPPKSNLESLEAGNRKHTVMAGETLYGIAKIYNVSMTDLMKWNKKDDYSIKEGEIVIIHLK